MEIPEYVSSQIQDLINKAQVKYNRSTPNERAAQLSTASGQLQFLRQKLSSGSAEGLSPELESQLQRIIELTDDPSSNEYLSQIYKLLEQFQKGRNWDSSA